MKRHIRPSFIIVTVGAAAAIGGACSSSTLITNPPGNFPDDAGGDGAAVTCPTTAPMPGDPCIGTGSCQIDGGTNACGFPLGPTAQCIDGKWQLTGTSGGCNPGAPVDAGSDAADEASSDAASSDAADSGD